MSGAVPLLLCGLSESACLQEKDVEDFIATASDPQDTRRSSPLGLAGDSDGSEHSESQLALLSLV